MNFSRMRLRSDGSPVGELDHPGSNIAESLGRGVKCELNSLALTEESDVHSLCHDAKPDVSSLYLDTKPNVSSLSIDKGQKARSLIFR